jgi:kynurenine formamidase
MKLIDVTLPFDANQPTRPGNTPFTEMFCLPLRILGADGTPTRVVLRQS